MLQITNAVERYGKLILTELSEAKIKCWIAGGALRDYFAGVEVTTDYDLFFPNESEFEKAAKYFKEKNCEVKWESENGMKIIYTGKTFDLVKKYFATPQETVDAFDFTVSMFAVDTETVYYGETTFIDLAKRQLMINKITYPASTLSRAFRYYKKGFSMCLGEMKKLAESIRDMPAPIETAQNTPIGADDNIPSGDSFFNGID